MLYTTVYKSTSLASWQDANCVYKLNCTYVLQQASSLLVAYMAVFLTMNSIQNVKKIHVDT